MAADTETVTTAVCTFLDLCDGTMAACTFLDLCDDKVAACTFLDLCDDTIGIVFEGLRCFEAVCLRRTCRRLFALGGGRRAAIAKEFRGLGCSDACRCVAPGREVPAKTCLHWGHPGCALPGRPAAEAYELSPQSLAAGGHTEHLAEYFRHTDIMEYTRSPVIATTCHMKIWECLLSIAPDYGKGQDIVNRAVESGAVATLLLAQMFVRTGAYRQSLLMAADRGHIDMMRFLLGDPGYDYLPHAAALAAIHPRFEGKEYLAGPSLLRVCWSSIRPDRISQSEGLYRIQRRLLELGVESAVYFELTYQHWSLSSLFHMLESRRFDMLPSVCSLPEVLTNTPLREITLAVVYSSHPYVDEVRGELMYRWADLLEACRRDWAELARTVYEDFCRNGYRMSESQIADNANIRPADIKTVQAYLTGRYGKCLPFPDGCGPLVFSEKLQAQ